MSLSLGGIPYQPHPGARIHCCRCSLPGLTGFTACRRESADTEHHYPPILRAESPRCKPRVNCFM